MRKTKPLKKVDVILIFMLEEEREYFLRYNNQFITFEQDCDNYKEFIFFDKLGTQRKGVMVSNGNSMGNTEACALFYKLSRYYKADLYINLGVAGVNSKDINIGDVILVSKKLSTFSEENATDTEWQSNNITGSFLNYSDDAHFNIKKTLTDLSDYSRNKVELFKEKLTKKVPIEYMDNFKEFDKNRIISGGCVTVPEVIKGEHGKDKFPIVRKNLDVIDMEAYYLVLWHNLIKQIESKNSIKNSKILVFKSPSDYGDEYKKVLEECGSRDLAMDNLCWVVSNYCTKVHDFPGKNSENIYSYFDSSIKNYSSDDFVKNGSNNFDDVMRCFEKLCEYFIDVDDQNFDKGECISSAFRALSSNDRKTILLSGRSGTAKSTFMSYLYYYALKEGCKAILVDFSKYSSNTVPSDMQMIYYLEKLLSSQSDLYIFLDGIDIKAPYYNALFNLLEEKNNYVNISYCIGNVIGNDESIYLVPKRLNGINIDFRGVNLHSNDFEPMLSKAEEYFRLLKCDFNSNMVKPFIMNAGLNNVDFRLLSMLSNNCQEINRRKSLYTFLNNYITGKFTKKTLEKYRKSEFIFSAEKNNDVPTDLLRLNNNTYAVSLAVSQEIIDVFENNDRERISVLLKSKFVLSDDMNLFMKHLLKHKQTNVTGNIVDVLIDENYEKSICVETQLLYSVGNAIKSENTQYIQFKNYLEEKIRKIEKDALSANIDFSYLIQYRTICIILSRYFNVNEPLDKYISLLLKENLVATNNLYFHFLYYSKAPFTFEHINKFNMNYLNLEMFLNTYYVLKSFLEGKEVQNGVVSNNPFAYMNIITFLQLIDEVMIKKEQFVHLKSEARKTVENLKKIIDGVISHKCDRLAYISKTSDLIILILNKIKD